MKLQPGDHVAQKDLTDEQYHAIAKKFIGSGAIDGEYPSYGHNRTLPFFGWHPQGNDLFHGQKHVFSGRLLTPSQILEDDEWDEKNLPPVGTVCEMQHGGHQGRWRAVEILKHGEDGKIACLGIKEFEGSTKGNLFWLGTTSRRYFRPIKSDRDKSISAAAEIIRKEHMARAINSIDCPHVAAAIELEKAGLLKLPEGE